MKSKLLITVSILIIILFSIKLVVIDEWKRSISETEIKNLIERINQSNEAPKSFLNQYDLLFPNSRSSTMISYHWELLMSFFKTSYDFSDNHICPCLSPSILDSSIQYKFKGVENVNYKIGWALFNKAKPEKCFDYIFESSIYYKNGKKLVGINAVSLEVFNKPVTNLGKDSLVYLIDFAFGK
jgi:hypothetical protein